MATPAPHPEQDAPLARLLSLASRRLTDELHDRLAAAGFTDQRAAHDAVFANVPPEGIHLTDLAGRAGMTKQAMSELVVDLEHLGYVRRAADPADRRAKLIEFTDRGWSAVRAALEALRDIETDLAESVRPARLRQLRRTLLDVVAPGSPG